MNQAMLMLLSLLSITGSAAASVEFHGGVAVDDQVHWIDVYVTDDGQTVILIDGQQPGAAPGTPELPALPGTPGVPMIPSVPELPTLPEAPTPGVPSIPTLPGLPPIPTLP